MVGRGVYTWLAMASTRVSGTGKSADIVAQSDPEKDKITTMVLCIWLSCKAWSVTECLGGLAEIYDENVGLKFGLKLGHSAPSQIPSPVLTPYGVHTV